MISKYMGNIQVVKNAIFASEFFCVTKLRSNLFLLYHLGLDFNVKLERKGDGKIKMRRVFKFLQKIR